MREDEVPIPVRRRAVASEEAFAPPGPPGGLGGDRDEAGLVVRRVRALVKGPPVTCRPDTPATEAARLMTWRRVGSVVVVDDAGAPLGIVTDQDLRARLLAEGLPPATPAARIMSAPLLGIEPDRSALDALLEMTRANLHHLGVMEGARLVGVVSSHDLMLLQGAHPVALARQIEEPTSPEALAAVTGQIPGLVRRLAAEGVGVFDLGRIVAELNDRLVRRLVALAEASLEAAGLGRPPVAYSWLAAGSEGRREQTLKTDQDNALVYEDPPGARRPEVAAYFGRLAAEVGAALATAGFPVCDGGFMASNPRWCQPASAWRACFVEWMDTPAPARLLEASIYFDLRPVAGGEGPGEALWAWVCGRAPSATLFLRHLARDAVERTPALGLFGRFVVDRSGPHAGRLDLKGRGTFPMTQAMRVYALSLGVLETNTVDRLVAAGARGAFAAAEVRDLRDAYEAVFRLRLGHQLACADAGRPADNYVDPRALGQADRLLLRDAFRTLRGLQRALADRFMTDSLA